MQTIAFPMGFLTVTEEPGHDGLFIWPEHYCIPPMPGLMVPVAIPPTNIRTTPCPRCGAISHFWALHRQVPHLCLTCMHKFAVVSVPLDKWAMVRPYVHGGNPWIHKGYKPVIPSYAGAPLYEEIDESPEPEADGSLIITRQATSTTSRLLTVYDENGNIVLL